MATWNASYKKGVANEITFCSKEYDEAKAVEKVCAAVMDGKVKNPDDVRIVRHGTLIDFDEPDYLISHHAVYQVLHNLGGCDALDEYSRGWDEAINAAIEELNNICAIDAKEVKTHGKTKAKEKHS